MPREWRIRSRRNTPTLWPNSRCDMRGTSGGAETPRPPGGRGSARSASMSISHSTAPRSSTTLTAVRAPPGQLTGCRPGSGLQANQSWSYPGRTDREAVASWTLRASDICGPGHGEVGIEVVREVVLDDVAGRGDPGTVAPEVLQNAIQAGDAVRLADSEGMQGERHQPAAMDLRFASQFVELSDATPGVSRCLHVRTHQQRRVVELIAVGQG